jgi:DNA-directed RNA polymerase subunit L
MKDMKFINNIKKNEDSISFDLNNNSKEIKISLANAIRRTIISDIETYIIDPNKVVFYENNSILNNEFLKHRISLIPVISDIENIDYENIIIECKKNNDDENIISVYVSDFVCKDEKTGEIIDNSKLFKYPKILFAKLKLNQYISLEGKLTKNNPTNGNDSAYMAVSKCVYTFKIDQKEVKSITNNMSKEEKTSFLTQENERVYERNEIGDPNVYEFIIDSIGFYEPLKIVHKGFDYLIKHLENVKNEFLNTKSNIVQHIESEDLNSDFYDFLMDNENDTIGNLLTSYLMSNSKVNYCGYVIKHPLRKNIVLRIKLNEENTLDKNVEVIIKMIDYIIDLLTKINKELK